MWSTNLSREFGEAMVVAMLNVVADLRTKVSVIVIHHANFVIERTIEHLVIGWYMWPLMSP
jgi:hypothetical protein